MLLEDIIPHITDWLMVIITFVYVVATILICIFNGRSAKATNNQVSESQRQYEETKRLEHRPYFDVVSVEDVSERNLFDSDILLFLGKQHSDTCTILPEWIMMKNIGAGTAINLTYSWKSNNSEKQTGVFPFSTFEKNETRTVGIHVNVELLPQFASYNAEASLILHYQDLLENRYEQEIALFFDISTASKTELKNMKVCAPKLRN